MRPNLKKQDTNNNTITAMDYSGFKSRTETESHIEWILENNFEPNIHPTFLVSTILYGNQAIDQKLKLSHL